jgi:hypothetical protein
MTLNGERGESSSLPAEGQHEVCSVGEMPGLTRRRFEFCLPRHWTTDPKARGPVTVNQHG